MLSSAFCRLAVLVVVLSCAVHAADLVASSTAPTVTLTDTDAVGNLGGERWQYNAAGANGTLSQQAISTTGAVVATDYVMTRTATGASDHRWNLGTNLGLRSLINSGVPQVQTPNGTVGVPGMSFVGEPTTGLTWMGNGNLGISLSGFERVHLGTPQNWGQTVFILNHNLLPIAGLHPRVAGTLPFWVVGRDSTIAGMGVDTFSSVPQIIGRRANGGAATPAAVANYDILAEFGGSGFGSTVYSPTSRASVKLHASQAWTDTANGTFITFSTTPNGTTTPVSAGWVDANGVLAWGGNRDGLGIYAGSTVRPVIQAMGTATNAAIGVCRFSNDDQPAALHLAKTRSPNVWQNTAVAANDQLGAITVGGGDGTDVATAAQILVEADGAVANNQVPGRIRLITASATGALVEALRITKDGNIGIGMTTPANKLEVNGTIRAKEVIVETTGNWADHVFADGYTLRPLPDVAAYIAEHRHLPEVPSAAELEASGLSLAEMSRLHMQKIEELTLYVLTLEADKTALERRLDAIEARISK